MPCFAPHTTNTECTGHQLSLSFSLTFSFSGLEALLNPKGSHEEIHYEFPAM